MENGAKSKSHVRIFRSIVIPVLGLGLVAFVDTQVRDEAVRSAYFDKCVAIGYILLGNLLAYRLICRVGLDLLLAAAKGRPVPKILKHLIAIATVALAVLLSINVLFSAAFTGLLTFSSVIAVVVGFALRPIILDIFSGLSANLDSAFRIGDWIEITGPGGGGISTGWVQEINWRTTHIRTRSGNLVVCPNSVLSTAIIMNYSRPSVLSRFDLRVKLPPELDAPRASKVLLAAVEATLDRGEGPSSAIAPDVLITGMEASGVGYWIRFWLDPSARSPDRAIDKVADSVLKHLQLAGIPLSEKVILHRDTRVILDPGSARVEVLANIALFKGIAPDALHRLSEAVDFTAFSRGDRLISQGTDGNDMFVLVEGAVEVLVAVDGREVPVDHIQAGDYFGEMSLLTGEPRTATIRATTGGVAYRIDRLSVAPLLESDPDLMALLSRNLAERNLNRSAKITASFDGNPEQKQESLAAILLGKMMAIFRSGR